MEIDTGRSLLQVGIHVERVIGFVRQKYSILQSTFPISSFQSDGSLSTANKMITICCAPCNCYDSVVPF